MAMTKLFSFSFTSGHLLLFVVLSLLLDVTYSYTTAEPSRGDVKKVEVSGKSGNSITLMWNKVNNIPTYLLQYKDNGISKVENINASDSGASVTHEVSPLTAGTKYSFTLFTVFEEVNSTGHPFQAVTAPENVKEVEVSGQSENSITLMWDKVNNIPTYLLQYEDNGISKVENINSPDSETSVTHEVSPLTAGTEYSFTLFTVFEEVNSTGHPFQAVTAPENVKEVEVSGQSENSITLMWNKVNNIPTYLLQYEDNGISKVEKINSPDSGASVTHEVSPLTAGTKYSFTLFTVFEEVNSTGHPFQAVTAPENVKEVEVSGQSENSLTLMWNKVNNIPTYLLQYEDNSISKVENINSPDSETSVTHEVSPLTAGTEYSFTLFTVFEEVNSTGHPFQAVTAPLKEEEFKAVTQNETSITLRWTTVDGILNYILSFNRREINITAPAGHEQVTHTITGLTSGTRYNFTLFTVFENASSSGVNHTAATVPSQVTSVSVTERSTTSITLSSKVDVDKDWSYFFQMNGESVLLPPNRATGVVSHTFTSLQPGRAYPFGIVTHFFGLNSTAYEDSTVTRIDCASVRWHVTTSSIQGTVEGLFTNATAKYESQEHVSPGGPNVSFTGLYPGATYELHLWYENSSKHLDQCEHNQTIIPPRLHANCENWDAGYSVRIVWDEPEGVWTAVEVNVTGKSPKKVNHGEHYTILPGFLPAKHYEVSLSSLSGIGKGSEQRSEPYVFSCATDPRGVIAGSVFAVLLFVVLVCLIVFILLRKRPDIIRRKKPFTVGSKQSNKKCKTISVAKFPDHFYQLSGDDNRGFSQEYESLLPVGTRQTQKIALLPENKARNRLDNVLPYDWCRVKLTTSDPNATSDYINASYIPGYNSDREYIATQGPLRSTVNDFWRMIWEQKVKGIVMVTNCTEGGWIKCERYWPAKSVPCRYGELTVTNNSGQQEPNWTLREFRVKHSKTSEERTVKHFHFTAWPDHGVPQGTEVLIQFRGLVRQHIQREGAGAPTVVHCSAGVGRTGTIIALDVLLQQLEKERAVGINAFVHKMRLNRPHMVQTESLYIFLHQCVMNCLQTAERAEENLYENPDSIYDTELRVFHTNP
ncbi:receptor-type tyrosine-protein phosphatase H-like [Sparus aurata]|uniref:receptor-type tyrosine-protein phosphatase H-like n=1 Tax=Sparus aurata TaxID=8175 RepID=UPI0011C1AC29|nr:receptor-type tyrosine-protein phosphatase H [Sparus aurata]